jgi:hypothetical protein
MQTAQAYPIDYTNQPQYQQQTNVCYNQPQTTPTVVYTQCEQQQGAGNTTIIIQQQNEMYCGPVSLCVAIVLVFLFWPGALCVPLCPCDERPMVTTVTQGQPSVVVLQP